MKLDLIAELYELISVGCENVPNRKRAIELRRRGLDAFLSPNGLKKVAFDTRRINQETDFNPRRGLQNYSRSEQFITEATANKITSLSKLQNVLIGLKDKYGHEHEWQDSKARVLLNTLNNGLRTGLNDDYVLAQPGTGSLDYIEELLDTRYRLRLENIDKLAEDKLKEIILSKDEDLSRSKASKNIEITNHDVATKSYDTLMEKLFGGIKATEAGKSVSRTVTITIKDSIIEDEET